MYLSFCSHLTNEQMAIILVAVIVPFIYKGLPRLGKRLNFKIYTESCSAIVQATITA